MTDKCLAEKDLTEKLMIEEYKVLRQEHENNRKFVFERPLILLATLLAAVANFKEPPSLAQEVLPLIFLTGLWFNLWFTYGRMISSSRIVAYIQVVIEGSSVKWIGWESALTAFREWQYKVKEKIETEPVVPTDQIDGNGIYVYVFYFHLVSGVLFSVVSLSRSEWIQRICCGVATSTDWIWLLCHVASQTLFLLGSLQFRPSKARPAIRFYSAVWQRILPKGDQPHAI